MSFAHVLKANPKGINQYTKGGGGGDSKNPQKMGSTTSSGGAKTAMSQAHKILDVLGDGLMYDDGKGNISGPMSDAGFKAALPKVQSAMTNAGFTGSAGKWKSSTHTARMFQNNGFVEFDIQPLPKAAKKSDIDVVLGL